MLLGAVTICRLQKKELNNAAEKWTFKKIQFADSNLDMRKMRPIKMNVPYQKLDLSKKVGMLLGTVTICRKCPLLKMLLVRAAEKRRLKRNYERM